VRYGDVQLSAFKREAISINDSKRRVANAKRAGKVTERITVRNGSSARRSFYVVVRPQGTRSLDAGYTLRVGP
jgi:hypothetical protein